MARFNSIKEHYAESDGATETACGLITRNHSEYGRTGAPRSAMSFTTNRFYVNCQRCRDANNKQKQEVGNDG